MPRSPLRNGARHSPTSPRARGRRDVYSRMYGKIRAEARFDTSADVLPLAPGGHRLAAVRFDTCPGTDLSIDCVRENTSDRDANGIVTDSWWSVRTSRLPDRTMRLFNGAKSMGHLLRRYAFLDASHCVNQTFAHAIFAPADSPLPACALHVPSHLRNATGVPQFFPRSGICWYATLCTVSFSDLEVRDFLKRYLSPELSRLCDTCLLERESSLAFRNELWSTYSIGDDTSLPPEMDGCNGFAEFTTICARFGVPLLRFKESRGHFEPMRCGVKDKKGTPLDCVAPKTKADTHLLVVRFQDGDHRRFPVRRRIEHNGVRYRLVGIYGGQRKCGHQIGIASTTGHWRDMAIGDADMHKDGIGMVFIHFPSPGWMDEDDWWRAWKEVIHVTKFGANGRDLCNHNLHNETDCSLDRCKGKTTGKGTNSLDVLYISCRC